MRFKSVVQRLLGKSLLEVLGGPLLAGGVTEDFFDRAGHFGALATGHARRPLLDTAVWMKDVLDLLHTPAGLSK